MTVESGNKTKWNSITERYNKLKTQGMDLIANYTELKTKLENWKKIQKKICTQINKETKG